MINEHPPVVYSGKPGDYKSFLNDTVRESLPIQLMDWQDDFVRQSLSYDENKKPVYNNSVLIVPRQNGKTASLVVIVLLSMLRGQSILYTAQSENSLKSFFKDFQKFVRSSVFYPLFRDNELRKTSAAKDRAISMYNPRGEKMATVDFVTRGSNGGSRGLSFKTLIFDEFQELNNEILSEYLAISSSFSGGQNYFVGTAPQVTNSNFMWLKGFLDELRVNEKTLYYSYESDKLVEPDNTDKFWKEVAKHNPSFGQKFGKNQTLDRDSFNLSGDSLSFNIERLCFMAQRSSGKAPFNIKQLISNPFNVERAKTFTDEQDFTIVALKADEDRLYLTSLVWKDGEAYFEIYDSYEFSSTTVKELSKTFKNLLNDENVIKVIIDGGKAKSSAEMVLSALGHTLNHPKINVTSLSDLMTSTSILEKSVDKIHLAETQVPTIEEIAKLTERRYIGNKKDAYAYKMFGKAKSGITSAIFEALSLSYYQALSINSQIERDKNVDSNIQFLPIGEFF